MLPRPPFKGWKVKDVSDFTLLAQSPDEFPLTVSWGRGGWNF